MATVDIVPTYGALYVGIIFAAFLQGVLFLQTYNYFENFPQDRLSLKVFVAIVWLLDLAHLILSGQTTYDYLVTGWGDLSDLAHATVGLDIHLSFIGLVALMCQSFYLYRIYLLSGKNYLLVGFLALGCLATFGIALTLSISFLHESLVSSFGKSQYQPLGISLFSVGAGFDILITGLMCYYLQKGKTGFQRTNTVIARVMQYTIASGLATTALAIATLIVSQVQPNSLAFIAMHFSLGRMYTNAIIYSLNSRQKFLRNDVVSGNVMMTFEVQEGTTGSSGSLPSHRGKLGVNKAIESGRKGRKDSDCTNIVSFK